MKNDQSATIGWFVTAGSPDFSLLCSASVARDDMVADRNQFGGMIDYWLNPD
jgi:hypothetical protein